MDIEYLIKEARQTMLTEGHVMPMIHLALSENFLVLALDVLSDSQSIPVQCGILARLGWERCKEYPGQAPLACAFYGEAWRVTSPEDDDVKMRPVRSSKRQEIITVQSWRADRTPQYQAWMLPVIRDHKKRVIEVGPAEGPKPVKSYQIEAFIHGVRDSQRPDDEVLGRMEGQLAQVIGHLSDEKKQALREMLRQEGMDGMAGKFGLE